MKVSISDLRDHDRAAAIVADAVAKLSLRFGPLGLAPEAIFQGSIIGASATLGAVRGSSPGEIADLLENIADRLRHSRDPGAELAAKNDNGESLRPN